MGDSPIIIYKVTIVEELVVGSKFGICKAGILQLLYCWQILLCCINSSSLNDRSTLRRLIRGENLCVSV